MSMRIYTDYASLMLSYGALKLLPFWTRSAAIRASRKSSPRSRRNNSENFSDKYGHENCVILRENNNAVILPLRR